MASILTPKLPEVLMKTPELRHKLTQMTDTYLREGGSYVQYNILDADVLRAAKLEPEKHRDLIVRVGGYSAYFVALSPEIQDEIIARTEHQL
jgi:formate C-acetyltransferase